MQNKKSDTAATRQFILLLAALMLLLPLTGWMVVKIQGPQVEQEAYANLAAIARLKTDQIENWLGERLKTAEVLSADAVFAQQVARLTENPAQSGPEQTAVLQRFALLRSAFDYDTIDLLDLGGNLLASISGQTDTPLSYSILAQKMSQSEQVVRLDLTVNAQGQTELCWLLPVHDVSGPKRRLIALVLMGISPERFLFPVIQTWPTSSPSGETLLVSREGDMAVFMNELRHRSGTAMKLRLPMSDAALPAAVALGSHAPGIVLGADHRGVAVLAAYRPVAGTDWRVVAKIDQAEVLAPVHVLAWWVSAVTTLAIVALAWVLGLLWRQLRRAQRLEVLAQKTRSDQLTERFFSLPFIGIATGDLARARWDRFNDHFCSIVGCPPSQMSTLGWSDLVEPEDLVQDLQGYDQLMRGDIEAYEVERRIRRGDGAVAFVSLQLRTLADQDDLTPRCIIMLQDITLRRMAELKIKRQSQLYAALSACNQAIVQCSARDDLFARICETAVVLGGMKTAWIGLLDTTTQRVVHVASFGPDTDTLVGIEVSVDADSVYGRGSAGTAIRENRPVWIQDFPDAESTAPLHALGARSRWRATASIPLRRDGRAVGVFVLVAGEVNAFDQEAQDLLIEIASDLDFALANFELEAQRKQTEQLLLRSQTQLALALKGSSDAPWDWNLVTRRLEYSPQGWHMLGYGVDDMPSGPGRWEALIHPQDLPLVEQLQQQEFESSGNVMVKELRLRHKSGHYVPVLSRGFISRDESGRAVRVTGTNMDLTVQHQAQQIEALRSFSLELIASDSDIEQILQRLLHKLEELLPAGRGAAWLLHQPTGHLRLSAVCAMAGLVEQARAVLPVAPDAGPQGQVAFSAANTGSLALTGSPLRTTLAAMAGQASLAACWSAPILSGPGQVLGVLDVFMKPGGTVGVHEVTLIDRVSYFMGSAIERKASEAQKRLAAEVFAQSSDGIMITDANQQLILVNPVFSVITGYSAEEVVGCTPKILASGRHDREFYASMWHCIHTDGMWQGELWNRRKNGEVYPQWLTISRMSNAHGECTHYVAIFADVSQKRADEARIKWMAHFDALTGLPNRALLTDRFAHALSMAQRSGEPLALMFLDLDHFKNINDSLGHGTGDEMLIGVARRMRQQVREQDTVARMGGDEFVLVLPGTDALGAAHLAQKLIDVIAKPLSIGDHELTVTPSLGIAMYPQDGGDLESLAKHADVAMYRAKQDGRNAYRFFAPDMQSHSARTLLLEGALRRALERQQLTLHYQPQLCLHTERIIGVEALLRWTHPELGMISPAEFIPIAEKSGLILSIGEWVLRTATRQLSSWINSGLVPIVMAVNLSAVQFRHPNLPALVSRILDEAGLPAAYLELELTEGVASHDPNGAIAIMGDLHARGVRMSIDDFGTGYSSLSYLKRFQVYKLKIDQSFVRDIAVNPEDKAIVSAIISMATSLGLQTIAEGVETLEQLDFLRAQGCDEMQGYFCSRPLAAPDCENFLRGRLLMADA